MASYLLKNGEVLCEFLPSPGRPFPMEREDCWHDCMVVTTVRVIARPTDIFVIVIAGITIPFLFTSCRIAVEGWEVAGRVLM